MKQAAYYQLLKQSTDCIVTYVCRTPLACAQPINKAGGLSSTQTVDRLHCDMCDARRWPAHSQPIKQAVN